MRCFHSDRSRNRVGSSQETFLHISMNYKCNVKYSGYDLHEFHLRMFSSNLVEEVIDEHTFLDVILVQVQHNERFIRGLGNLVDVVLSTDFDHFPKLRFWCMIFQFLQSKKSRRESYLFCLYCARKASSNSSSSSSSSWRFLLANVSYPSTFSWFLR